MNKLYILTGLLIFGTSTLYAPIHEYAIYTLTTATFVTGIFILRSYQAQLSRHDLSRTEHLESKEKDSELTR